jgi:hypothetical protein
MTWFIEDPWPLLFVGLALQAILLVAFFQTGRVVILPGMLLLLLVSAALYIVEQTIVTEQEEIENALYGVADALVRNDEEAVMRYLAPNSAEIRSRARWALQTFEVTKVKIGSDLKIAVNPLASPRSATATFTGRIDLADDSSERLHTNFVARFTIVLVRQDDRWLLASYEEGQ